MTHPVRFWHSFSHESASSVRSNSCVPGTPEKRFLITLNAFVLTTLDATTRITRYITEEFFGIRNIYAASLLVVFAGGFLALSGKWMLLWPAFGAANQLIAGIALLVATFWLMNRGKNALVTLVPACFMMITTVAAFVVQFHQAVLRTDAAGAWNPDTIIAFISVVLTAIAGMILWETGKLIRYRPVKINAV